MSETTKKLGERYRWTGSEGWWIFGDIGEVRRKSDGSLGLWNARRNAFCHDCAMVNVPTLTRIPDAPTEQGPRVPQVGDVWRRNLHEQFEVRLEEQLKHGSWRTTIVSSQDPYFRVGDSQNCDGFVEVKGAWTLVCSAPTPHVEVPPPAAAPPVPEKRVSRRWDQDPERWDQERHDPGHIARMTAHRDGLHKAAATDRRVAAFASLGDAPWRPGDSAVAAARGAKPDWRTRGGRR